MVTIKFTRNGGSVNFNVTSPSHPSTSCHLETEGSTLGYRDRATEIILLQFASIRRKCAYIRKGYNIMAVITKGSKAKLVDYLFILFF